MNSYGSKSESSNLKGFNTGSYGSSSRSEGLLSWMDSRTISIVRYVTIFGICYLFGFFGSEWISESSSESSMSTVTRHMRRLSSEPEIKFYNDYTIDRPYGLDYPFENIVEPYMVTTFYVSNPQSGYDYKWYVDGWHKDDGESVDISFSQEAGITSEVTVKAMENDEEKSSSTIKVITKYVRREIRAMNDQDREAFFQAVAVMQRVPTHVGQAIYGKNYHSKDYFNRLHLYYGGSKSCDHWHQGPGFVTSHITMSYQYEQAVQSVYPSATLPYWDFTLESTFYTPTTFRDSGVFTEDWFGDPFCNNTLHTPLTGRFAYAPSMQNAENYSVIYNPYGILRSPWNADPHPYMTRAHTIYGWYNNLKPSGCKEYNHGLLWSDWDTLSKQLNGNAHGHIHELMGGSWNGTKLTTPTTVDSWADAYEFAHLTEGLSKILWRYDYLLCPENCALDEPCECVCTAESLRNMTSQEILEATDIMSGLIYYDKNGNVIEDFVNKKGKTYFPLDGYTEEETVEIFDEIMHILCHPGYIGDMFQATSTNDITFWVLHPNLDRLWHRLRVNEERGLITFDNTWPDDEITCHGHFSYDLTPFMNIYDSNNTLYSNAQLFDILNPVKDYYPYVYEHLIWSHCTLIGYDMTGTVLKSKD